MLPSAPTATLVPALLPPGLAYDLAQSNDSGSRQSAALAGSTSPVHAPKVPSAPQVCVPALHEPLPLVPAGPS